VEEGSFITTSSLDLPETFKGFFLDEQTCEDEPFDLETPITENLTLIQASFNDQAPCIQLDYIVLNGRPVAGTTLSVDVFPLRANVSISWYTSVNNRTYREIPGETESTYTVRPEDSGKFIIVYVVSDSNPPVVRYDTIKLDVFGTVSSGGVGSLSCNLISNASEFMDIINNLSACYELTNNIDLSGISYTQSAINTSFNEPFEGSLDGNGFSISGLTITSSGSVGLFSIISDATIENLTLSGINIVGNSDVGILTGYSRRSLINNVNIINSNISGSSAIGSVAGVTENSTIQNSQILNVSVNGTSNQVGGLVGRAESTSQFENIQIKNSNITGNFQVGGIIGFSIFSTISQASFLGTVHGVRQVGGIIGELNISTIGEAFNSGVVSSTEIEVGGIVGFMTGGSTIEDSYNNGNVSSSLDRVGGIVGNINGLGNRIINSYAAANVTGSSNIGAVGAIAGNVQSGTNIEFIQIYWNTNIFSGDAVGYTDNAVTSGSILGITNGAMRNLDTFISSQYDISDQTMNSNTTWLINRAKNSGFPYLRWNDENLIVEDTLEFLDLGFIPINSAEDLIAINNSSERIWASGTSYEISTEGGISRKYILVNNIDLTSKSIFTTSFTNLGLIAAQFEGELNGNGYQISNLSISNPSSNSANNRFGLFKSISGASIKNLNINNFNITGNYNIGAIAGEAFGNNVFENITGSDITLHSFRVGDSGDGSLMGGLVGRLNLEASMNVSNVNLVMNMTSGSRYLGGLIGQTASNTNVTLNGIEIKGYIQGSSVIGSLIGNALGNVHSVNNVINRANIIGGDAIGGFFGSSNPSNLKMVNVGQFGTITSDKTAGGFIGQFTGQNLIISESFNTGTVSAIGNSGGLIGYLRANSSEITNSYNIATSISGGVIESGNTNPDTGVGGLIGRFDDGVITMANIYISSIVTPSGTRAGNVIGFIFISDTTSIINYSGGSVIYNQSTNLNTLSDIGDNENGAATINGNAIERSNILMKDINTFAISGYDISNDPQTNSIWLINPSKNDGFPYLRWSEE
jgi:hypothetical protein